MYSYHVHSTLSDGKHTPEEIVKAAIEAGLVALGFSDHGFTDGDLSYCMQDEDAYIREINRLKEAYAGQIQLYRGVEEDALCPRQREKFEYIIGSCHYIVKDGKLLPIDSSPECFEQCLLLFDGDPVALAQSYYQNFCAYICRRKPDIIGHFDLITKYDEPDKRLFLENPQYTAVAETYVLKALQSGCIFEVNTGAIARGLRTAPYPQENLLYILRKHNVPIILSSDSHQADTLTFRFDETKRYLKDIGFQKQTVLLDNAFREIDL
ncbi:MAG: histidinol-phosphatase HisJ family protein [Clostridia bacterium]|nr:histidinol-phosphatase HisJ family protein [Clostridia bacterium]